MPKLSYHLRWNNHLQNLQSLFENLYSEQSLVDVTISCSDGLLYAHKLVLSACSPYFEHIFKGNPCKHPILILRGIKRHDMQILLEYMYVGSVDVVEEDLEMLLSIATELQIKGLMQCPEQQSDILYQSIVNEKMQSFNKDSKSRVNSPSPVPKNIDNLKWQAELVAQPTVSKPRENVSRNDQHLDSSHNSPDEDHQVHNQILNIKSEPLGENHVGLEMYNSPHNKEQIVTKKEIPDECSIGELSMDYHQAQETIEKHSESFEVAHNFLEKKPINKDDIDCFCRVCNRSFQNKVSYHRHMMTHSGIKPHRCTFCTQSFLRLSHLQRHIRVHTGERPYSCVKCPKQFARSDKLRQHYLFQHNDSKVNKVPKPRGRPRKNVELYGQSPASCEDPSLNNTSIYPPLSIIPLSSNSV